MTRNNGFVDVRPLIKEKVKVSDIFPHQIKNGRAECKDGNSDSASFVSTDDENWFCFSCATKGGLFKGDVITLYMHLHNLSFKEAIHEMCKEYDIALNPKQEKFIHNQNRINSILEDFCSKCEYQLHHLQNGKYLQMLKNERNFIDELIVSQRLGLFNSDVKNYLLDEYKTEELIQAGFIKPETKRFAFAKRFVYPYLDINNNPRYFIYGYLKNEPDFNAPKIDPNTGKKKGAKYVKHKTTNLKYIKNPIFGLNTLYNQSNQNKPLIIAEGICDALHVIQAGFPVISPITTNIPESKWNEVARCCKSFHKTVVIFDSELTQRGEDGAIKTIKNLLKRNINVHYGEILSQDKLRYLKEVGKIPGGKIDIDDFLKQFDTVEEQHKKLTMLVNQSKEGLEYLVQLLPKHNYTDGMIFELIEYTKDDLSLQDRLGKLIAQNSSISERRFQDYLTKFHQQNTMNKGGIDEILIHQDSKKLSYILNDQSQNKLFRGHKLISKDDGITTISHMIRGDQIGFCAFLAGRIVRNPLYLVKHTDSDPHAEMRVEYEFKIQPQNKTIYPNPITIRVDKINDFPKILREMGFAVDDTEITKKFSYIWNYLMNEQRITQETIPSKDGLFLIGNEPIFKNGASTINKGDNRSISPEEVGKSCNIITELHDKYYKNHNPTRLITLLKWGIVLPTAYVRKKGNFDEVMNIPNQICTGEPRTGKSEYAINIRAIYNRNDPEKSVSAISKAQLRDSISHSGFMIEYKEISPLFDEKASWKLQYLKASIESKTSDAKYYKDMFLQYPNLSSGFFAGNKMRLNDGGFGRRGMYHNFTKSDKINIAEQKDYHEYMSVNRKDLQYLGLFAGIWFVNHWNESINLAWKDLADMILKSAFEYSGKTIPKWITDWTSETYEENAQSSQDILRQQFIERIQNAYFNRYSKLNSDRDLSIWEMYEVLLGKKVLPEIYQKSNDLICFPSFIINQFNVDGITSFKAWLDVIGFEKTISKIVKIPKNKLQKGDKPSQRMKCVPSDEVRIFLENQFELELETEGESNSEEKDPKVEHLFQFLSEISKSCDNRMTIHYIEKHYISSPKRSQKEILEMLDILIIKNRIENNDWIYCVKN